MFSILSFALVSICFCPLGLHTYCQLPVPYRTTYLCQPGLSIGFVDKLKKKSTNRKHKKIDKHTAMFIELLPQLEISIFHCQKSLGDFKSCLAVSKLPRNLRRSISLMLMGETSNTVCRDRE